ncbi:MAG: type III-B CRISPR module RAMP protein Cmr4 [Proteobacteria bacterium]|nr:type III-B CRISPR module RAMP protein Cmr4 [Pseudomonadota bacterium]
MNAHMLLALYAQTNIHAGTGQNTISSIDLPIQREAHTGYPCVYGSATKGAIRAKFESENNANVKRLFGDAGDTGNAGCLAITDTRLLLLPVRSLTSHFKWVTCPALLTRFKQDMARMNKTTPEAITVSGEQAIIHNSAQSGDLYLEEYRLTAQAQDLTAWIEAIEQLMPTGSKAALEKQLTVVSDDLFAFLAQNSTPVHAHNAIDSATKTVKAGALWWEESLPSDTLLYTCVHAFNSRDREGNKDATANLDDFKQAFANNAYLQIGGNETVGMGFCLTKCL